MTDWDRIKRLLAEQQGAAQPAPDDEPLIAPAPPDPHADPKEWEMHDDSADRVKAALSGDIEALKTLNHVEGMALLGMLAEMQSPQRRQMREGMAALMRRATVTLPCETVALLEAAARTLIQMGARGLEGSVKDELVEAEKRARAARERAWEDYIEAHPDVKAELDRLARGFVTGLGIDPDTGAQVAAVTDDPDDEMGPSTVDRTN